MSRKNDVYSNIASMKVDLSDRGLERPPVEQNSNIRLPLTNFNDFIECPKKIDTAKELQCEVDRQRKYYASFLKDLAPKIKNLRNRIYLRDFDWRLKGQNKCKKIKIPHYDAPVGLHTAFYKSEFFIEEQFCKEKHIFICFKGADYKAHVFINDNFVGSHEGFFSPFEFEITQYIHIGKNKLDIRLENDYKMDAGDKIYAATGPGYDEPNIGWHHCPAGMGIYQDVYIENRSNVFISDIFVRTKRDLEHCELWLEVFNCECDKKKVEFKFSVYGQNFNEIVFEDKVYKPITSREIGIGDSLGEAMARKKSLLDKPVELLMGKGVNYLKIPFEIKNAKIWNLKTPYLYQIQIKLILDGKIVDFRSNQFGMRSFKLDINCQPKGFFYLNDEKIRLRGTNTMGHEQQDVMKKDFDRLIDDIILAKICNINFFRLTQRPVQKEVYDYCDKMGIMTQTDFPMFGVLRTNKFCEALKQVEEMEKLIRSHPCNVIISYINEPFPNANNSPHRNLSRTELLNFFDCADKIVQMNNPDRVIKHVDGDYDPPSKTLPDNHCYTMWYNGNGVDIGKLNKGEWMPIKPDWNFGCGEFGAEGIDSSELMKELYPKSWLPKDKEDEKNWTPNRVVGAQTGNFHYFFYETPKDFEDWCNKSREYQAFAVKWQTECYRRNPRMVSFAIHLFIDAFPSNWMKTIIDVNRNPKPAYFAYKNALEPVLVSLRTDNFKYFSGSEVKMDVWICNDTNEIHKGAKIVYKIEQQNIGGIKDAIIEKCMPVCQGTITFIAPKVQHRKEIRVKLALIDKDQKVINFTEQQIEIFPQIKTTNVKVLPIGEKAERIISEMGLLKSKLANVIIVSTYNDYLNNKTFLEKQLSNGAKVLFLELTNGDYEIFGNTIKVRFSAMLPLHFVSRDTNHPIVNEFLPNDFRYWYQGEEDCLVPLINSTFTAKGFNPILSSGNVNEKGEWGYALAVGEKKYLKGSIIHCQLDLEDRVQYNPISKMFLNNLISYGEQSN